MLLTTTPCRVHPAAGLYLGAFGPHGPELLQLSRLMMDGEEWVHAVKVTGETDSTWIRFESTESVAAAVVVWVHAVKMMGEPRRQRAGSSQHSLFGWLVAAAGAKWVWC